jgi:hypothetical protein
MVGAFWRRAAINRTRSGPRACSAHCKSARTTRHRGLGIRIDQEHAAAALGGQGPDEIGGEGRLPTPPLELAIVIICPRLRAKLSPDGLRIYKSIAPRP